MFKNLVRVEVTNTPAYFALVLKPGDGCWLKAILSHDTQHNDTQENDIFHNDTQHTQYVTT
jgi:hypothetical protein